MNLPHWLPNGLAFVDIETNGGAPQRESITEIGIVEVDADGVRRWSSLVRPDARIPPSIERLTGITNDMVANAPRFAELADTVFDRLDLRLFVAHNARFDHGYLRAAFRRLGMDLRPRVLCTVKLSRRLHPQHRRHSLDHLIERHQLQVAARHRALGDAEALLQFWSHLQGSFSAAELEDAVRDAIGRPSLPPYLDPAEIEAIPERPGVYLFYGDNALPLYVGKSRRLRTRVLSHFSADHLSARELQLCQQVRRIEWQPTAGELGALLREAQLIKALQPTHNRRLRRNAGTCAWRLQPDLLGDLRLDLVAAEDCAFDGNARLYGFFGSRRQALARLQALAREHRLCPPLLGLESRPPGGRCFTHQIRRCEGACHGAETPQQHHARLIDALEPLRIADWPHPGAVALREGSELHVIERWRHLGTATEPTAAGALLAAPRPAFDADVHRILERAFAAGAERLPLAPPR